MSVRAHAALWEDAPLDESRADVYYAAACSVCGAVQSLRLTEDGFVCRGEHWSDSFAKVVDVLFD